LLFLSVSVFIKTLTIQGFTNQIVKELLPSVLPGDQLTITEKQTQRQLALRLCCLR
jgi:hypothetical protein